MLCGRYCARKKWAARTFQNRDSFSFCSFAVQQATDNVRLMKTLSALSLIAFLALVLPPLGASAADCAAEARKLANAQGAEVLSVTDAGGSCEIKLLVPGKNGKPPRVVTKTVSG